MSITEAMIQTEIKVSEENKTKQKNGVIRCQLMLKIVGQAGDFVGEYFVGIFGI